MPRCLFIATLLLAAPLAVAEEARLSPYQEAFVFYKSGKFDDALGRVNALLEKNPDDTATLLLKGRVLIKQGRGAEAEACLSKAGRRDAALHEAQYWLGEAAFAQGHWGEAAQCYRAYLEKVPGDKPSLLKIIYCHVAAGDLPPAAQLIVKLDPADEHSPAYYFAHAALASATGKNADCQRSLQQARTLYGNETYNEYEPDWLLTLKGAAGR